MVKNNNDNKSQNDTTKGKINFELLESFSPKDFILIKEPPKYLASVPQVRFLYLNIGGKSGLPSKSSSKMIRRAYVNIAAPKIKLISTALAEYNPQGSDLSVQHKDIDRMSARKKGAKTQGKDEKKGFDYSLIWKGAIVFLSVIALLTLSVLANKLFENYYDEGIEVAKKTINTVVEVKAGEFLASGVIVRESGGKTYILTNCHVTDGHHDEIKIRFVNETDWTSAVFVNEYRDYDLALIYISRTGYSIAKKAKGSVTAEYGQTVYAVGNSLGNGISITKGIISQPKAPIESKLPVDPGQYFKNNIAIKFDAAINGGNSGGGLFNKRGELIGIVFGYKSTNPAPVFPEDYDPDEITWTEGAQNVSYAVPLGLVEIFLNSCF